MTSAEFKKSLQLSSPPSGMSPQFLALWNDAKGNWEKAHSLAQSVDGPDGAWVHAYLHRKEGDSSNASYWYSRSGKPFSKKSLREEWEEIVSALCAHESKG